MTTTLDHDSSVNVAVPRGVCSAPPDLRRLGSGRRLATLSVRTRGPAANATSVPVSVWDPPAWVETLHTGDDVVVVGLVHRRFFRTAAGPPGARVEVEARCVARATPAQLARALRKAERALEAMA